MKDDRQVLASVKNKQLKYLGHVLVHQSKYLNRKNKEKTLDREEKALTDLQSSLLYEETGRTIHANHTRLTYDLNPLKHINFHNLMGTILTEVAILYTNEQSNQRISKFVVLVCSSTLVFLRNVCFS